MASKNNRICIICGNKYSYCGSCRGDVGKPSWYNIFDGERCNEIYDICVSYRDNVIDVKEAYERIQKIDLSDLENFASSTKTQIEEILRYKKVQPEANEPKETEVKMDKTNSTRNIKNKK